MNVCSMRITSSYVYNSIPLSPPSHLYSSSILPPLSTFPSPPLLSPPHIHSPNLTSPLPTSTPPLPTSTLPTCILPFLPSPCALPSPLPSPPPSPPPISPPHLQFGSSSHDCSVHCVCSPAIAHPSHTLSRHC